MIINWPKMDAVWDKAHELECGCAIPRGDKCRGVTLEFFINSFHLVDAEDQKEQFFEFLDDCEESEADADFRMLCFVETWIRDWDRPVPVEA